MEIPKIVRSFGTISGITEQPTGLDFGLSDAFVKSFQVGIASGASTINAVDTTKTFVRLSSIGATNSSTSPYIVLTNSTTVTVTNTGGNLRWEVVELKKVKSLQSGTAAGGPVLYISITPVTNQSKCSIFFSYGGSSETTGYITSVNFSGTSSIAITHSSSTFTAYWFLVEWE